MASAIPYSVGFRPVAGRFRSFFTWFTGAVKTVIPNIRETLGIVYSRFASLVEKSSMKGIPESPAGDGITYGCRVSQSAGGNQSGFVFAGNSVNACVYLPVASDHGG